MTQTSYTLDHKTCPEHLFKNTCPNPSSKRSNLAALTRGPGNLYSKFPGTHVHQIPHNWEVSYFIVSDF